MDDEFKDAMKQIFREAPPELVAGFKKKMSFIQGQYKHSKTTVQSCLDGMADPPSLLELLTAAYVINGGLLFKHGEEQEEVDDDYTTLMREMEELHCSTETAAPPAGRRTLIPPSDAPWKIGRTVSDGDTGEAGVKTKGTSLDGEQ
jgi:hypothetical protein